MQWRAEAACVGADPDLFAEQDTHPARTLRQLQETADLFCAVCPVRDECREESNNYKHTGLWGGVYKHRREGRIQTRVLVNSIRRPLRAVS